MKKTNKQLTLWLVALAMLSNTLRADDVQVTGNVVADATWYATNRYVLNGPVYVISNATLTIEAGTVVWGKPGTNENASALFVCQGAKLMAEGTAHNPIIFTAENDEIGVTDDFLYTDTGKWGGVILLGRAVLNKAQDVAGDAATPRFDLYEGLNDEVKAGQYVHRYGGNDDGDSSGVIRYVSLRHGGALIKSPDKEINGLSLCCVGSNTIIDHVEVFANSDDAFEFFGGTVNTKYLVAAFCEDETFDTDQGFRGMGQFWFGIHKSTTPEWGNEWNGAPKENVVSNLPLATLKVYNQTLIGAGSPNTGKAILIRDYSAPSIYNSIWQDFQKQGLDVDADSGWFLTNGVIEIKETLWHNIGGTLATPAAAAYVFAPVANSNVVANPQLRGVSRTPNHGLDPRPAAGSPALVSSVTAPNNGFLTPVSFKGAFSAEDLWVTKWTALEEYGFLPTKTNDVQITANVVADTMWYATNRYTLNGPIYVISNATLTIEAGTVIWGKPGTNENASALFVCQGAKLMAEGTAHNPIIFTAENDEIGVTDDFLYTDTGKWGGVILLGRAVLNKAQDVTGDAATPRYDLYEGLNDEVKSGQNVHRYGGNDDGDSSGVIRYVSLRHGGSLIKSPDKEINGLSLCCVGSNTVIDHVEVFANSDDAFEFFGGTVNTKYLVAAFCEDETFDTDQGFRGMGQFWFGIHKSSTPEWGNEWNGAPKETVVSNLPLATLKVYNQTLIGAGSPNTGKAILIRDYSAPSIYNSIWQDFQKQGMDVDADSGWFLTNGVIEIKETLWHNIGGTLATPAAAAYVFAPVANSNVVANPLLRGVSRMPDHGLDPRPAAGSPALVSSITAPNNGFLTPVSFKGAFDAEYNWAVQWTAAGEYGIMSPAGGAEKVYLPAAVAPTPDAPRLAIGSSAGSSLLITCASETGHTYTLESTDSLSPASWGAATSVTPANPQAGTGGVLTFTVQASGAKFFRVVVQ